MNSYIQKLQNNYKYYSNTVLSIVIKQNFVSSPQLKSDAGAKWEKIRQYAYCVGLMYT